MRRVTDDADRRQTTTDATQRPLLVWPPTLCVGGPVINEYSGPIVEYHAEEKTDKQR